MLNKLKISFLGLLILSAGCYKETPAFLEETNSRKQVEADVKETEEMESNAEQFQKLEKSDITSPEVPEFVNLSEPDLPDLEK